MKKTLLLGIIVPLLTLSCNKGDINTIKSELQELQEEVTQEPETIPIAKSHYHSIYPASIKKSKYGITVWVEERYPDPQLDEETNEYYRSSKVQYLIDCNGMKISVMTFIAYSETGEEINNWSISESEAYNTYTETTSVVPETYDWYIVEETCRRYNKGN